MVMMMMMMLAGDNSLLVHQISLPVTGRDIRGK
jgi:hypothetical protein